MKDWIYKVFNICELGENGTIDGQGEAWWQQFHRKKLKYTRPYLIEIMHSDTIQISNLTFLNSPSWNVHPVYSRSLSLSSEKNKKISSKKCEINQFIIIGFDVELQQYNYPRPDNPSSSNISKHRWDQSRCVINLLSRLSHSIRNLDNGVSIFA